jgi:hypothetical protein
MTFSDPKRTLLGVFLPVELSERPGRRLFQLGIEALSFTLVSTYLPVTLGFEEAGLVSLFLIAAALSDRLSLLLEENRRDIWERRVRGWRANRGTAGGILALLCGVFAGYAIVAYLLGESRVAGLFGFALRAAALGGETLLERDFGTFSAVLAHNAGVFVVIACLSFVYRAYGAMLALTWNASVWALVITTLALRGGPSAGLAGFAPVVLAVAALAPHLVLEGLAYVAASLAFLFASKGMTTYSGRDPRLRRVLIASTMLTLAGCVALLVAAAIEVYLAPLTLSLL